MGRGTHWNLISAVTAAPWHSSEPSEQGTETPMSWQNLGGFSLFWGQNGDENPPQMDFFPPTVPPLGDTLAWPEKSSKVMC